MKLTSLAIAATLIGSAIPAHATDWWSPNYQVKKCEVSKTPDQMYRLLTANGYPDATLSELGPGIVLIWLTANHTNNLVYYKDRADCDGLARGVGEYNQKFN